MTNDLKDNLFILIKSLTKSEKRQFTLYVGRMDSNENSKFLNLFQLLDKMNRYDEKVILKKGIVTKQQLSNLKAHLYKQILISLRMNPMHKNIRILIREQLDFATILYQKGLYKQSLKILEKSKLLANKHQEKYVAYDIVELEKIIENAISLKSSRKSNDLLVGKYIALIFEKSSTRTRVSFEVAMNQLGGKASFLSISDLQLGRGEPLEDTARVIGSMADGVVLRTLKHKTQETFKSFSSSSTINGLSDLSHPCQVLTDLLTYYEENGSIEGEKVCWSGDFNNVCYSYAEAANLFGFKLHVACPKEFQPKDQTLPNVTFTESLDEAIEDSSLVTTDVWVSMGDEKEKEKREQLFKEYQINPLVMDKASEKAIFLHCLPAIRGQEVSEELLEDKRSKVWTQAENRLHSQKALLVELLK